MRYQQGLRPIDCLIGRAFHILAILELVSIFNNHLAFNDSRAHCGGFLDGKSSCKCPALSEHGSQSFQIQ